MSRSKSIRDHLPLVGMVAALILVVLVLPSALNTPQSNPTTTPEFAPVPPTGEESQAVGNAASFGLASSAGLATAARTTTTLPAVGEGSSNLAVTGKTPSTKRCVGRPPRQSEDPLSPPCVADFRGSNFGATYQGVTEGEVRVLFYLDGGVDWATSGTHPGKTPKNTYIDLLTPEKADDNIFVHNLRVYQQYFNDRYQTYNRFVHFFVYFGSGSKDSDSRRADGVDAFTKVQPFAVLTYLYFGNDQPFLEELARRGVLNFGSFSARSSAFFAQYPGLVWGYQPSAERQADSFVSLVCSRVVNRNVTFSGEVTDNGQPRKLGLLYTTDPLFPGLKIVTDRVRKGITACGGVIDSEASYSEVASSGGSDTSGSTTGMARFKQRGITTIIWTGGYDTNTTQAASGLSYHPEWVLLGEGTSEGNNTAFLQDQSEFAHAWVVTSVTRYPAVQRRQCYQAFVEIDPTAASSDIDYYACRPFYDQTRQLFTGIQVAGPRLTPQSIDQGFHAIPAVASSDPTLPSCYYDPGDYTCVKDAVAEWWDSAASSPDSPSQHGCWRMPDEGARYLNGKWPNSDVEANKTPNDPCNYYRANT